MRPTDGMTSMEAAIIRMMNLQSSTDPEASGAEADHILCEMLLDLGCDRLVAEYRKVPRYM